MSANRMPYSALDNSGEFIARHIGPSSADQASMLEVLGVGSLDELIDKTVPKSIRSSQPLDLERPISENATLTRLRLMADRIKVARSMIGMGYYPTRTPGVIQRNILENPAWYTAYTPYQPEISQGRLEALLNFQTMICDLTGMEISNASLLDEGTAAAEAMAFCRKSAKAKGDVLFVSSHCHPQTIDVLRTRAEPVGIQVVVGDEADGIGDQAFAVVLQYPDTNGEIRDYAALCDAAHAQDAMVIVAADLLALTVLTPGEWGADVVVGSSQRFGVPMGFGGPHAAFLPPATRTSAVSRVAWWASRSTVRGIRPTDWHCRPASSTSAARRRPAISARPRFCSRSWRPCMPSITVRPASRVLRGGCIGSP